VSVLSKNRPKRIFYIAKICFPQCFLNFCDFIYSFIQMTQPELKTKLADSLQAVAEWLQSVNESEWQRTQNGKWTIGQEFEHLRVSTQGMAFLLSAANRPNWRPTDRPSRTYDALLAEYQAGLETIRNSLANNPAAPSAESESLTVVQQTQRWAKTAQQLLGVLDALTEADLDGHTVWKHPVLGPVTGRETVYFTIYHTHHHRDSLAHKQVNEMTD
jgi:uncharacterized damage-inducible protein DinB